MQGSTIPLSPIGASMKRLLCLAAVLVCPSFALADNDDVQKELKSLQGSWKTVGMEVGGNPLPKDQIFSFTISVGADGKSTGKLVEEEFKFAITVDPSKKPKTINNVHETGDQKGKKQFGIYKLEGDKWTVCMSRPGAEEADRPKDFVTKDSPCVIFVFERVKEEKKP
jgi:uncharacterized protein (TIGR03067 family)